MNNRLRANLSCLTQLLLKGVFLIIDFTGSGLYYVLKIIGFRFDTKSKNQQLKLGDGVTGLAGLDVYYNEVEKIRQLGKIPDSLLHSANAGDPKAQFRIGWFCGDIVGKDEALIWIERAANAGHPSAQLSLGFGYATGDLIAGNKIPRNLTFAFKWLTLGLRSDSCWQPRIVLALVKVCMKRTEVSEATKLIEAWEPLRSVSPTDGPL